MSKVSPTTIMAGLVVLGLGFLGYQTLDQNARIAQLEGELTKRNTAIDEILGEVTRMRLEQTASAKGPAGLLEKLATYSPMLSSASVTEPDYQSARSEMNAILRAFETIGDDAWKPVRDRIEALDPSKNYDELKWLLEAAVAVNEKAGIDLARTVLLGLEKPSPRLRWYAADLLLRERKQLAQVALRQILLTESSRGINHERAMAYGAALPDPAAFATTGFHNFVTKYTRSDDAKMADTLLMVIGRSEHDLITVQECIEALGKLECERAVNAIEKLYRNPPGFSHNPLFQIRCIDALVNIQGEAARPFLEEVLPKATTDTVAKHLSRILAKPIVAKEASIVGQPREK